MKKCFLTLLAFATILISGFGFSSQASAQAVEFELLGKLGGGGTFIDKASLGDSEFNVAGGLQTSVLFRFKNGAAVGLNFNWTMLNQQLDQTKLTYALKMKDRSLTTQYPSIGITARYLAKEIIDLGVWMNYGFGSAAIDYDKKAFDKTLGKAYNLVSNSGRVANFDWDMQTLEIGLMGAFVWVIPSVPELSVVVGLQFYADFSRLDRADSTLQDARDINGRRLDENSIQTLGFNIVFGARYDLFLK